MKGDTRLKILDVLERGFKISAEISSDIIDAFIIISTAHYGSSMGHLNHLLSKRKNDRAHRKSQAGHYQKMHELFYHLKKDGLIERKSKKGQIWYIVTSAGTLALERLRQRKQHEFPSKKVYRASTVDNLKIVIFDIPEKERRKRDWLRDILGHLGFRMLQKSVFAGRVALPPNFIDDIVKYKLADYIEIFLVNKTGSLRKLNI